MKLKFWQRRSSKVDLSDYADPAAVVRIRVYNEPTGLDEPDWHIDGVDRDGRFTEACWNFDTQVEALAAIPEFRTNHHVNRRAKIKVQT